MKMNKYIEQIKKNLKFECRGICISDHEIIMKIIAALDIKDICSQITMLYWPVYSLGEDEIAFKWLNSQYKEELVIVHDEMYDKFDDDIWDYLNKLTFSEIKAGFIADINQKQTALDNLRNRYLEFMNNNIE
jgi:hypothetical protein